jgi:putative flippase GtrA
MNRHAEEIVRYGINGVAATAVHYFVLFSGIEFFQLNSAGFANLLASIFGISVSFIGNRYFVFRSRENRICAQAIKFIGLYMIIGFLHGLTLYFWSDVYRLNYHYGFMIAVTIQFLLGYLAGKTIIFGKHSAS